ncbi:MAG: glycoside hydrolase family 2 TIM barrel-domain containing protein [Armatimonadota bacterium]
MKTILDLSELKWSLSGWTPYLWLIERTMEVGASPNAEIRVDNIKIPCSVQKILKDANIIPDWNEGLNHRLCEWVENRHWIFETKIPDSMIFEGKKHVLYCEGLDYKGRIRINGQDVYNFKGTHIPHFADITEFLKPTDNILQIVFEDSPRWLGQFGYTSKMTEFKTRFNYTWDWISRLVQIGIWEPIKLEITDGIKLDFVQLSSSYDINQKKGSLEINIKSKANGGIQLELELLDSGGKLVRNEKVFADELNQSKCFWGNLDVDCWWPNGIGNQPLYSFHVKLLDSNGQLHDYCTKIIGFKDIKWLPCEDAPENADPWICQVNGEKIFLQGANWTPIHPNFADTKEEDYSKRLKLYAELGMNILRVWGGGYLERECFYNICDELGIMVWQEYPMSSSGVESIPPSDPSAIQEMCKIAESYIMRRGHHVSLLLWSGGNELEAKKALPVDNTHPMIKALAEVTEKLDPLRRFIPSSPSGPTTYAHPENYGKGVHWDVHGPWKCTSSLEEWKEYWENDDSLLRSETGVPGCQPAELTERYKGDCEVLPVHWDNPLWSRGSTWWIEWEAFYNDFKRHPNTLEEYVEWSQKRQAELLQVAAISCKTRFPKCGGIIIWMGHDCFPCNANTSIIDFNGDPKPSAHALAKIFKNEL